MRERGIDEFDEIKHIGEFWHGITDGEGCAVYDDYRDSHMKASEFINFIDYNKHQLNIKGGSVTNSYNLIIITSIQRINEIYYTIPYEAREQWIRRVSIVDMYTIDTHIDPQTTTGDTPLPAVTGEAGAPSPAIV